MFYRCNHLLGKKKNLEETDPNIEEVVIKSIYTIYTKLYKNTRVSAFCQLTFSQNTFKPERTFVLSLEAFLLSKKISERRRWTDQFTDQCVLCSDDMVLHVVVLGFIPGIGAFAACPSLSLPCFLSIFCSIKALCQQIF